MTTLRFDHPEMLLLALAAIPLLVLGWRALVLTDPLRRFVALTLRAGLFVALALALAGPKWEQKHDHLTVIGLLDISGSVRRFADLPAISTEGGADVRRSNLEYLRQWFRAATKMKEPDDRFGLIVFDGRAIAISAPTKSEYVDDNLDLGLAQGTNIAEAVRLGLAMFPPDTAKRLVLITDGNETAGDVREAIKQTSKRQNVKTSKRERADEGLDVSTFQRFDLSIPIDVLPIAYNITGDVQVVRVEAPPGALPLQTVTVRMILEAASPTSGTLTLRREGEPVDLNGTEPGAARRVDLPQGQSVHLAQVALGETPINRFEAIFEADDPAANVLPDNDRAEAFTATPSQGSVLVLDSNAGREANVLVEMLNVAGLPAQAARPDQLPGDLLSLRNFDLIVLDNIAAAQVPAAQQELLARYVNDLGGGLIMTGGENSFGAGGWNNTLVENLLPLELDPSKQMRLPTAALVLVIDKSGSMRANVAGARATQQAVANEGAARAIESLRSDSLVGVVTFDMFSHTLIPLQPNENPKKLSQQVRSIMADGGTNMEPALQRAYAMLKDADAAKKRVVCLSDGRSHSTDFADVTAKFKEANIQLSTIAVGDDADHETMQKLAQACGGEFFEVRDPRKLPLVLVESVQIINRPLIKEVPFQPKVLATGSTLTAGMDTAPPLNALVLTTPKNNAKVALEMVTPNDEPLLAHWQSGLGRVAAFTSDVGGQWSERWRDWPTAATFWTQLARTMSRPAMSQDAELLANIKDDRLHLTFDMTAGADGGFVDYLQVEGMVFRPDGSMTPVRLRQNGPGRYEASVEAELAGNYIVALNPRQGTKQLSPAIGGASRSTSPEFRRYKSNLALLEEIVEATDGRRLDVNDPLKVNLFDRAGMPVSVSLLPAWRTILFWVLAVVLLDVACRRIAWDANLLRQMVERAIARVTPSYVRGGEAAATLATLRRVSATVEERHTSDAAGIEKFAGTGRIMPPPERIMEQPMESTPPLEAPDSSKVAAAIDLLLGRKTTAPGAAPAESSAAPPVDPGAAATETTGSLLRAKRRAREQLRGDTEQIQ